MSKVLGIDFSSKALDLALLDETTNKAEHTRVPLKGAESFAAALSVRQALRAAPIDFDSVYLIAVELPKARQFPAARSYGRIEVALALALPRDTPTLWLTPAEWHREFVGKGNARKGEPPIKQQVWVRCAELGFHHDDWNATDAYGVAWSGRALNERGIAAADARDAA